MRRYCANILFDRCGTNVNLERKVDMGNAKGISIGNNSGIGIRAQVRGPLSIGDNVMMGPDVIILTHGHIYDLIDIFQNHDELYDSLPLLEYYLKEVKLLKEEKILMQCILSIVPQVQLNLQEEVNIYQMSKLICYLDGLQEIFKKLMIDEK